MKKSRLLGAVCACFFAVQANATIVKYVINGQLDHQTDFDHNYLIDLYDLDGAYFTREMIVDTSVAPDYFSNGNVTVWHDTSGYLISNSYYITGRPGGAADLHIYTSVYTAVMRVGNEYSPAMDKYYDSINLGAAQLTGVLVDLYDGGQSIYFDGDYIPGKNTYVTEPPYPFDESDIDRFITYDSWAYSPDGHLGTIDGKELFYKTVLLSAYASAVPIPASVWLFGSGLLGLVGMARRKKVA